MAAVARRRLRPEAATYYETTAVFPPDDDKGRFILVPRFFKPAETLEEHSKRDRVQYKRWVDEGLIIATPGNVVDYSYLRESILEDQRLYEVEGAPYDPWNATQLAVELSEKGLPVAEFIQGLRSYTLPTKEFLNHLAATRFNHGNHPVLSWMASNLFVQKDKNENMMPTKAKSTGRIDGITASIMALGAHLIAMIENTGNFGEDYEVPVWA